MSMSALSPSNAAHHSNLYRSYANPHDTIAMRDTPSNIYQVMKLCLYYYCTDPLLGAVVDKLSEYPITQLDINRKGNHNASDSQLSDWRGLLDTHIGIRTHLKMMNVEKRTMGMSARYVHYPFSRYARVGNKMVALRNIRNLTVQTEVNPHTGAVALRGSGKLPGNSTTSNFILVDVKNTTRKAFKLVALNPLNMQKDYCPATNDCHWYWRPPQTIRRGIENNSRIMIEQTDRRIIAAAMLDRPIRLRDSRLWISKSESIPGIWDGHGFPPLYRVLEDVYYLKLLRRANEALAEEHITPMRVFSPAGTGDVSAQRTMNMADWMSDLRQEVEAFRRDPNHTIITRIPLNGEQFGGQARVMMVAAEIESASRTIAAGLGCPLELVWGGLNWSGANVSLRVLENHFLHDREDHHKFLDFLTPRLSAYYDLPEIEARLTDFKMADDVQQQAQAINLLLQGYLDRDTVLTDMGVDPEKVWKSLERDHNRVNLITMRDNVAAAQMNYVIETLNQKAQVLMNYEVELLQADLEERRTRKDVHDRGSFVAHQHARNIASPIEFEVSAEILARMDPAVAEPLLADWARTMPNVTRLLMQRLGNPDPAATAATGEPGMEEGVPPGQYGDEGMMEADPGAAGDPGLEDGAEGVYEEDDGQAIEGGGYDDTPLPEQNPPRRTAGPI
jgi:hypothetical protein